MDSFVEYCIFDVQMGYASWTAMVKTFGAEALSVKALQPLLNVMGHVKLTNNPEERSQGWYVTERGTKQRHHHEQIEIFARQLKDAHNLTTKAVTEASSLPNHREVLMGPSDLEVLTFPEEILQGAEKLELNFACDVFKAEEAPQKLPKLKMSGFIMDILYDMGEEETEATSMEELEKFLVSFKAATTEQNWSGVVHCSFQQLEEVIDTWP